MKKNTLNNMQLGNIRKTQSYQAIITDLAIEGIVSLDTAESLLGYEIPEYLKSPSGKSVSRKADVKQSAKKKKDSGQTELDIGTAKE